METGFRGHVKCVCTLTNAQYTTAGFLEVIVKVSVVCISSCGYLHRKNEKDVKLTEIKTHKTSSSMQHECRETRGRYFFVYL